MRLTEVRAIKKGYGYTNKNVMDLCDTIEAQQQEIKDWQNRYEELDLGHSKLFRDFCKQQQEIQELKDYIESRKIKLVRRGGN